jgi:hypothetical protein
MMIRLAALMAMAAGSILASGGGSVNSGGAGGGVTAPTAAEIRTPSETIPAGGTVQVKHLLTQPRPISSGGTKFAMDSMLIAGVALSSPLGDTGGAAVFQNGSLSVSVVSPSSDFGTNLDYPFLTITMRIPASMPAGTTMPLGLTDTTFQSPTGPLTMTDPKPGVLTIGGSAFVDGVYPGGGTWPAGTVISVRGGGFQPGTKVITKMKTSTPEYVSPTEFRFTLQQQTTIDQQPILLKNPDGSQTEYFSYLRGVPVNKPASLLLQSTDPIFAQNTLPAATVGPIAPQGPSQFVALAVQNPSQGSVSVSFHLDRTGTTTTVILPSGGRIMDELANLLGGDAVAAGDTVTVTATAGVQILGLNCDDNAHTVSAFLPGF